MAGRPPSPSTLSLAKETRFAAAVLFMQLQSVCQILRQSCAGGLSVVECLLCSACLVAGADTAVLAWPQMVGIIRPRAQYERSAALAEMRWPSGHALP
jgi:hypothetical protein